MHNETRLRDSITYQNKVFEDLLRKAGITRAVLHGRVDIYFDNGILPDCEVKLSVNTTSAPALILTIPETKVEVGGSLPRIPPSVYEVDHLRFDDRWLMPLNGARKEPLPAYLVFKDPSAEISEANIH